MNYLLSVLTWQTVGLATIVLVVAEFLSKTRFVKNGDYKRAVVLALSLLLSGMNPESPETIALSTAVLSLATAAHELIEFLYEKYTDYIEKMEALPTE